MHFVLGSRKRAHLYLVETRTKFLTYIYLSVVNVSRKETTVVESSFVFSSAQKGRNRTVNMNDFSDIGKAFLEKTLLLASCLCEILTVCFKRCATAKYHSETSVNSITP